VIVYTLVMKSFGTIAWAEASEGTVTTTERMTMVLQGAKSLVLSRFPNKASTAIVDAERPRSQYALRAESLLEKAAPKSVVHHGMRTYAWAVAFAARDGITPDRELLYCASFLHDLGLTEVYLPKLGACFAHSGARGALAELREAGMPEPRAQIVAEAICLHVNLVVEIAKHGAEAHLLRAATACDVAGQNLSAIANAFREKTLEEFPRLDFKAQVTKDLATQTKNSPKTRMGFLCKHLGLIDMIHKTPFVS
jgi:HD superfamily phosphodiesterase